VQGLALQEGVAGRLPGGEELAEGGGQHQGPAFEDLRYLTMLVALGLSQVVSFIFIDGFYVDFILKYFFADDRATWLVVSFLALFQILVGHLVNIFLFST
jgi:hypothetical protein